MSQHRQHAALRASTRAFALAFTLIIGLAACACDGEDAPPAATPTNAPPTVAPTPTEAPPTLEGAARLEYEGEFEQAAATYAEVAAASSGVPRDDALLGQARTLGRDGRDEEARFALASAFTGAAPPSDASTLRFALGRALAAAGDSNGALDSLDRYIAAGGALTPYAQAERAPLLAALGRFDEAGLAGDAALATRLPEAKGALAYRLAAAFEDAGADGAALTWYARVEANGGDGAAALARAGAIRRRLGDPAWVQDYATAIARYPGSSDALDLLAALDDAGAATSDYTRGLVHYRAFNNDDARAAFERAAAGDNAGSATYYIGALDERAGDNAAAIDTYATAVALDPAGPLADDALWWRGRLLAAAQRYDEASAAFAQLATGYAASSARAAEARFQQGMMLYRATDHAGASFAWGAVAGSDVPDDERVRALFWQGRALQAAGRADEANTAFTRVIDEFPDEFYAIRAAAIVGRDGGGGSAPSLTPGTPDWAAIAGWVSSQRGIDPETAPPLLENDPRWPVGAALDEAGMHAESMGVYQSMITDNGGEDAVALYRMLRRFYDEGRTALAARAARTLYRSAPGFRAPHPELLRLSYPAAFGDLAERAAADEDIDPLLLMALMRQESFYDPLAGSPAGALGLTQVIEPTGRAIAGELGIDGFEMSDLYRPALSLRFGAHYIAGQLAEFDGNVYHALAAYNGGPGTAANAIETAGDDIDQFVEDLEFDETRLYVRLVVENYARYRQLYAGAGPHSLPD